MVCKFLSLSSYNVIEKDFWVSVHILCSSSIKKYVKKAQVLKHPLILM